MKKSLLALLCVFFILSLGSYGLVKLIGSNKESSLTSTDKTIVTSFYPEYIIVKNIIDKCNDIKLINMTSETTGCLHDYQITSKDMKTLTNCDALIINGGGMEPFITDISHSLPKLPIIDSSEGIKLIEETHSHKHEHKHEHNNDYTSDSSTISYNSHIWLNPNNYIKQIQTITKNLCTIYPEYKKVFNKNAKNYVNKVNALKKDIKKLTLLNNSSKKTNTNKKNNLESLKANNLDVIIFHDAFVYLADSFNFNIVDIVNIDSDTSLSAGTIADVINTIKKHDIKIMLSEKQFKDSIAKSISKETDAKVYILDSLVKGDYDKNAYINGMKNNIKTLKKIYE